MKRYEKYNPTGIQWLPEIPEHWESSKIKIHFRLRTTKSPTRIIPHYLFPRVQGAPLGSKRGRKCYRRD